MVITDASYSTANIEHFYKISMNTSSDKCKGHSYQEMYGQFLMPYMKDKHRRGENVRFFEIGLGCFGDNFFGGSAEMWHRIFKSTDSLWIADHEGGCIAKARAQGKLYNINTLVGSQADPVVLKTWMNTTGGAFDIIVDDGGHRNNQIYQSLHHLWSHVLPGGLYFIEDTQVGREGYYNEPGTIVVFSDLIKDWIEQLLINSATAKFTHKILPLVKAIFCQHEACVLLKCGPTDRGRCDHERNLLAQ
jgi:hypothetical protein